MGQTVVADPTHNLIAKPKSLNTQYSQHYQTMKVCSVMHVPFKKICTIHKSQKHHQLIAHFFHSRYISMKFTLKELRQTHNEGVFSSATNSFIYGYKFKAKSADKIKRDAQLNRVSKIGEFILFKKRIYATPQHAIRIFSQLKLLSLLQIGPFVGRMPDGSDGYINSEYLQFFGEVTFNIRNSSNKNKSKVAEQIIKKGFRIQNSLEIDLCFSPNKKAQIIKLLQFNKGKISLEQSSLVSTNNASAFLKRQYEQEAQKIINKIDKQTNQLSLIQNFVIQKNIDQSIELFQEVMQRIENQSEKHKYAHQFCQILLQSPYFSDYVEQVITEVLYTGQILKQSNQSETTYSSKLEELMNNIKIKSNDWSSENELEEFSKSFSRSKEQSSRNSMQSLKQLKMEQLKINVEGNNKKRVEQIIKEIKKMQQNQQYQKSSYYQIQFKYGVMLMKAGKSRFALMVFQVINRSQNAPLALKAKIYNYMGIIYYYKQTFIMGIREFQKSLGILYQMHYHSPAMMVACNNIACSYYRANQLSKALQFFNRSLNCGQFSSDYEMMTRSNKGMALIEKNMLKEAKNQFTMILKMIEPVNNASIICKAYGNLGYLNMIDNNFNEALIDLEIANRIEAICLIPNGCKPSIFLHNNMAMVYYKKKEYRKALAHIQKCKDQIEMLKGLDAVIINFNYAMTYQKLYFHEFALKHLADSRRFLQRLSQKQRYPYEKKIEIEIQKLNSIRIIEDSQESVHQSISSRYSAVTKYL